MSKVSNIEDPPLQTRVTFRGAEDSPLGTVQVTDEAGFAYLGQDIDFGATGSTEIYQNIKFIVLTEYFSTPLDREFGMDYSMVDKPMAVAEMALVQECALKIALYETRAQFRHIDFIRDEMVGRLSPSIKIALLTTQELPPRMPQLAGEAAAASVPGSATIEEVDLPSFYEAMIEIARIPGPQGPVGAKGDAATIEVGETTTGAPGTDAEVVNVGDASAAVFDFTIPKGDKGDQGTGITVKGTVSNSGSLPTTGNQPGDMWITADTGHGWTWDGDSWVDAGPIQGPPGPTGPQGDVGPQGVAGPSNVLTVQSTTTGAPGSNANVNIIGTSPAQALSFTIPRGDVGSQGIQGNQGPAGTAATATAGTTTTSAPGSNANVVNAGTTSAAVFNFTIPRGDVGAQGPQGAQGIQGPAGPANLGKAVVGDVAADPNIPNGIVVPSYLNHPDRIFTSPTAFHDHFEGTSLNAKWTVTGGAAAYKEYSVEGSCLNVMSSSPSSADGISYYLEFGQTIPNSNSFVISLKLDALLDSFAITGSKSYVAFSLHSTTPSVQGLQMRFVRTFASGVGSQDGTEFMRGLNLATVHTASYFGDYAKYVRFVWDRTALTTDIYYSVNGVRWMPFVSGFTSALTGLSASILPSRFAITVAGINQGRSAVSCDWITFVNT